MSDDNPDQSWSWSILVRLLVVAFRISLSLARAAWNFHWFITISKAIFNTRPTTQSRLDTLFTFHIHLVYLFLLLVVWCFWCWSNSNFQPWAWHYYYYSYSYPATLQTPYLGLTMRTRPLGTNRHHRRSIRDLNQNKDPDSCKYFNFYAVINRRRQ